MSNALTASRSSKSKGWILIALSLTVIVVVLALFDLTSQFKLRHIARNLATAAVERLTHPAPPRPTYPQVAPASQQSADPR